ncbi:hypothetical protein HZS_2172 [Henneguya salminicola]|nr:hypothetical protein HZS_2172 [Henneguya salminicola]
MQRSNQKIILQEQVRKLKQSVLANQKEFLTLNNQLPPDLRIDYEGLKRRFNQLHSENRPISYETHHSLI